MTHTDTRPNTGLAVYTCIYTCTFSRHHFEIVEMVALVLRRTDQVLRHVMLMMMPSIGDESAEYQDTST